VIFFFKHISAFYCHIGHNWSFFFYKLTLTILTLLTILISLTLTILTILTILISLTLTILTLLTILISLTLTILTLRKNVICNLEIN